MNLFFPIGKVAERYGISKSAVRSYVKKGIIPTPRRIGSSVRWAEEDLKAFEDNLTKFEIQEKDLSIGGNINGSLF